MLDYIHLCSPLMEFHGDHHVKGESLSLFLNPKDEDGSVFASGNRVFAKYKLSIKDQLRNNSLEENTSHWFDAKVSGWGYSYFIPLSVLKDRSKGYLENDELVIQVNFESILRITSVYYQCRSMGGYSST